MSEFPKDLADGESIEMKGSGSAVYTLKNTGGVYSCTCPAWAFQGAPIEKRSCKHLKRLRGDEAEKARVGAHFTPSKKTSAADAAKEAKKPPLLLAHKWENDVDLTGWWMSEKLDGVRAYWNGTTFLSRLGNEFHAPDWFVDELGDEPLDGELWVGRQEFQRTVSIVRRQDRSDHWKEVRYVVFDAPGEKGSFEERMEVARKRLEGLSYASALAQEPCEGLAHLRKELARVEGLGGEGLMLRKPGSKYVAGRSSTLLKVKTFHDAEGVVVGYVPGKGKHKGRTGALILELEDGTRFNAGTGLSDKERE
ncbi:MAG: DNA ligase, partial [Myxococcota bacterium]